MRTLILGCGYVGRVLARRLIARGVRVRATTTTEVELKALIALGAEPMLVGPRDEASYARAMSGMECVVHLAPPAEKPSIREQVAWIADGLSPSLRTYVYGSSTAAFGMIATQGDDAWVDEATDPKAPTLRGRARLEFERALRDAGVPIRVARIAGVYGPGRTLRDAIERDALLLIDGAPQTSRIHVEDLSRILEAMLARNAPELVVACDHRPASTVDVARYTCELLGRRLPAPLPLEDARRVLSPTAFEMRVGGHRCRSLVLEGLVGALAFPSYREGIRASLEAEGVTLGRA